MTTDPNGWHPEEPSVFETAEETHERLTNEERADRFAAWATDMVLGSIALAFLVVLGVITAKFAVWLWHVL